MNMKTRRLPWVRATTTLVCLAAAGLAQAQFRISTEGCRYSPAEIEAALGFATQDGRGGEVRIGASRQLSCNYLGKGSAHSLVLSQVLVEGGVTEASARSMAPGRLDRIDGDADGAGWHVPPGDSGADLILAYLRGGVWTSVRVSGVDPNNAEMQRVLRQRLLSLRRLP